MWVLYCAMEFTLVICLCITTLYQVEAAKKLPDFIKTCKRNDPNIASCWKTTLEDLRPHLVKGIQELNVHSIDPLLVPEFHLERDNSRVAVFDLKLINISVIGGKDFKLLKADIDLDKLTFKIEVEFNGIEMNSDYIAKGRVLRFDFDGDGDATIKFAKITVDTSGTGNMITKDGKEYVKWGTIGTKMKFSGAHFELRNLYKNDVQKTNSFNNIFNENIDLLYEDIEPIAQKLLGDYIGNAIKWVHDKYPFDVLYPKN